MLHRLLPLAAAITLAACSGEVPDEGGDLLTIYGAIGTIDRGPVQPETEPLFGRYGVEFDGAFVLNYGALAAFDQRTLRVDFPMGGAPHSFSGPLIRDVLAAADVRGQTIIVTAIDGYSREIAIERLETYDAIFAIEMDGRPLPLGGLGPVMLVWPRTTDDALADMNDDDWVWAAFLVEVVE